MRICDAFPAPVVDAIEQGSVVRQQECLTMSGVVIVQVPEFDIGVESAPEPDQAVTVTRGARGLGNQHTHPRTALGKHKPLDDGQEPFVIVESWFQIGSQYGQSALCGSSHFGCGCPGVLKSRQDPAPSPCFFGIHTSIVKTASGLKCQMRHSCAGQGESAPKARSGLAVGRLMGQPCCITDIGGRREGEQPGPLRGGQIDGLEEALQIVPGNAGSTSQGL